MLVSFVILTYRRPGQLTACLESLERAGAPGRAEAWVGFNGREPDAASAAGSIERRFPWARCAVLERTGRAEARNALIPRTRGELVYFLDDDTLVPEGFVERIVETCERFPDAPVVGGPNVAPPGSRPLERAIDFLLRSPLGAGPMRARYRRDGADRRAPGWSFMLCNFGVRRGVFERTGLFFPAGCASAEENLFLYEVEKAMGAPVFSPGLYVFHHRRPTAASFLSQAYVNGRGRGQITAAVPGSLQPVALVPPLFFLYLAALPWLPAAAALPAALYGLACLVETARLAAVELDPAAALRLAPLFICAHLSYAAGLASGLLSEKAIHADARPRVLRDISPADV